MEFDFKKDYFSDKKKVKLSMGHEAFGIWLEQEGQSKEWTESLLDIINQLQQRDISEYKLTGDEFTLFLNTEEASIVNHSLYQSDSELDEDLSFYDQEIEAECGLEDLQNLIDSWLAFF